MTTRLEQAPGRASALQVVPMDAALGAELHGVDLTQLDDATFQKIQQAWLDHLLIVFRGQSMQPQDLVNLAKRFGTPVTSSNLHQRDLAERTANQLFNLPPEIT